MRENNTCFAHLLCLFILHLSLQYFTSTQTFSHFLRQVNGLLQTIHIFWGKNSFSVFFKTTFLFVLKLMV